MVNQIIKANSWLGTICVKTPIYIITLVFTLNTGYSLADSDDGVKRGTRKVSQVLSMKVYKEMSKLQD